MVLKLLHSKRSFTDILPVPESPRENVNFKKPKDKQELEEKEILSWLEFEPRGRLRVLRACTNQ